MYFLGFISVLKMLPRNAWGREQTRSSCNGFEQNHRDNRCERNFFDLKM